MFSCRDDGGHCCFTYRPKYGISRRCSCTQRAHHRTRGTCRNEPHVTWDASLSCVFLCFLFFRLEDALQEREGDLRRDITTLQVKNVFVVLAHASRFLEVLFALIAMPLWFLIFFLTGWSNRAAMEAASSWNWSGFVERPTIWISCTRYCIFLRFRIKQHWCS